MRRTPNNPINRKIVAMIGSERGALKQFAAVADIDSHMLAQDISDDRMPKVDTLIAISRAHGVSLDDLCADYKPERRFAG